MGSICGQEGPEREVHDLIDAWHKAAAEADFPAYTGMMTADAVFIGTDATEIWHFEAFKSFAQPYFERGKAWSFTALKRNVYFSGDGDIAWFDELLDTQMELCRGSGILERQDGQWKIAHYVLSIAIPNEHVSKVVELKREQDSILGLKLQRANR